LIQRPSMGLLRRPTPGENCGGRTIQPALRAGRAFARNLRKPGCGFAAIPTFPRDGIADFPYVRVANFSDNCPDEVAAAPLVWP
jgi:hypothetical protein